MLLALSASDSKTRIRPEFSGQRAFCPVCGSEVVARCGRVNAWHWAHLSTTECDSWHESETEWHRQWKAEFPEANQEIVHFDSTTGEKHIADVKLDSGLVLEFQHSPISTEELASRCNFYKNILWIVDSRSNADLKRLLSGLGRRQPNLLLQRKNTAGLSWEFWDICSRLLVPNAGNLQNLTTYIDPSLYNGIFADQSFNAQNFWVQLGVDIKARRLMSAKVIPNL